MWVGLGAFAAMAGGFLWVMRRALAHGDPADLLAADDAERGPEPRPVRGGRHRRAQGRG